MASTHRIAELLTQGVKPTEPELLHLEDVGRFVSQPFGRYHGRRALGAPNAVGKRPQRWADSLSARLSAQTAERWSHGVGLSGSLLDGGWLGRWSLGEPGSHGYDYLDAERVALQLEDDEAPAAEVPSARYTPRRRSLFDAPRVKAGRRQRRQGGRQRHQVSDWRAGGKVAHEALLALEQGGLFLGDQLDESPGGEQGPEGGASPSPLVSLDGLHIGGATPALASALHWSEGAFAEAPQHSPFALSRSKIDRMLGSRLSHVAQAESRAPTAVFAFFDSVEGEFVNLREPTVAHAQAVGTERSQATTQRGMEQSVSRSPLAGLGGASMDALLRHASPSPSLASRGSAVHMGSSAHSRARPTIAQVSLNQVVQQGQGSRVRPYTMGVFPERREARQAQHEGQIKRRPGRVRREPLRCTLLDGVMTPLLVLVGGAARLFRASRVRRSETRGVRRCSVNNALR